MRNFLAHYLMPANEVPDINNLRKFTTGDVRTDFFDTAAGGKYTGTTPEEWLKVRPAALRLIAASKSNHHFVKTHCPTIKIDGQDLIPPNLTAAAVYILRNPFDLAPSFARHQGADLDTAITRMTDPEMVMGTEQGIFEPLGRWDDHVRVWTEAPGLPLHIVRYEDLHARPGKTFSDLLSKFLRVNVEKPKLARVIKETSFEKMQSQEKAIGFHEKPAGMESFFTKGKSGVWMDDLTPAQVGRIREAFLPTLEKWYPELLKVTAKFSASA